MPESFESPDEVMQHALELAAHGLGRVEPNPPVGAVVVDASGRLLGDGYHQQFGGPHAEVHALRAAGEAARGATLYVTLEPCCHVGKTPPCTEAIIAAGVARVVVAAQDPAPHADGAGLRRLQEAGVAVETGLLREQAEELIAPFTKLIRTGRPFVHAKWAMSWDGRIATRTGDSQWISGERSREVVHRLRGRMDAVLVGIGTALADDPLLTARPAGPRTATRVVLDSRARLPIDSQLVRTAESAPVLVAASSAADDDRLDALRQAGVEVFVPTEDDGGRPSLSALLDELGRRDMTNVLIEGGAAVLGSVMDQRLADAAHVFIGPKVIGGTDAYPAVGGAGAHLIDEAAELSGVHVHQIGADVYCRGRFQQ